MDALNRIVAVPTWAYDFCHYYLALALIIAIYTVWGVVKLLSLPSFVKQALPTPMLVFLMLLSGGISVLLSMMQFWVCRAALHPAAAHEKFTNHQKTMKLTEKFAAKCASDADCLAIAGTQRADSLCSCGGRGLCGSCMMNNNMEPQASFDSSFSPYR